MTDERLWIINGVSIPEHAIEDVTGLVSLATAGMNAGRGLLAKVEAINLVAGARPPSHHCPHGRTESKGTVTPSILRGRGGISHSLAFFAQKIGRPLTRSMIA